MKYYYARQSAHDARTLEIWRGATCHYLALFILPDWPATVKNDLFSYGFRSRRALADYCARAGVALFRCAGV